MVLSVDSNFYISRLKEWLGLAAHLLKP